MTYFEKEDILHLVISDEPESASLELSPNITAELNENSKFIRIENSQSKCFHSEYNSGCYLTWGLLLTTKLWTIFSGAGNL